MREFTQRCTDVLEMYVRRHPELWLWMHRRWRDTGLTTETEIGMFPTVERGSRQIEIDLPNRSRSSNWRVTSSPILQLSNSPIVLRSDRHAPPGAERAVGDFEAGRRLLALELGRAHEA